MPNAQVILPPSLTERDLRVVLKYFEKTGRLSPEDWRIALDTFAVLGDGRLHMGQRRLSFRSVYDRFVEDRHADHFIAELTALEDLSAAAEALQQTIAFEILGALEEEGLYSGELPGSEYLAAYCLYWWTSFARGYIFEVSVFRDLQTSGIEFFAHDLRRRNERRSPYDLVVLGQFGDVKNTTYFLYTTRTLPLKCDFYITRLYYATERRYLSVVFMTEAAWRTLDGEVAPAALMAAADLFPQPVLLSFQGRAFVIVPFELWKANVKQRQQEETP